ncbi:unnamed protein product [Symbiodinium sp. CCMP2592]|nr:unnamed protein product [Symbiodinium sp. CCMP2592]
MAMLKACTVRPRPIYVHLIAACLIGLGMQAFAGFPRSQSHQETRTGALRQAVPMTGSSGGKGGVLQAFFMGKRVDWSPALDVASKAVEVGGEMPLGVRFERREDGAFVITEIISGGSASVGELDVQVGNIIHAVSCSVGGKKEITSAFEVDTIDKMSQAILSNEDEQVKMLVEKPDEGAAGSISFLTDVATKF